ncbi:MAG: DNA-binding transcriptional ArsR family regulator [Alphaproteobacteria bacterium]|jgi:DNA-binding transcriptional ArsR family regulator
MKRDMDLIRTILLKIEDKSMDSATTVDIANVSRATTDYHLKLMVEAGLIDAGERQDRERKFEAWWVNDLTWRGHEILDTIRDPEVWRKTKATAQDIGGFSLSIIKDIAVGVIKDRLAGGV